MKFHPDDDIEYTACETEDCPNQVNYALGEDICADCLEELLDEAIKGATEDNE